MCEPEENRSSVDLRNRLNDLTGKQWLYFLKSVELTGEPTPAITRERLNELNEEAWAEFLAPVIDTCYPTKGEASYAHPVRRRHPSPKPPQLMQQIVEFFTKREGWVLDPFVGAGSTLLACAMTGRHGVGVDLSEEYLDLYRQASEQLGLELQRVYRGDARDLATLLGTDPPSFDLVLTDPPYGDMLSRRRTGERKKRGNDAPTPFTENAADLGNMDAEAFYDALQQAIRECLQFLKVHGYVVLFCKDLQPTAEDHNMIHVHVVETLMQIPNLRFRGYKIWYDRSLNLYPFGYPYAYVSNQLHQFILIFRKESE